MKMPRLKTILLTPVIVFVIVYIAIAIRVATYDNAAPAAAVKATQIGQAMMEVAARGDEFANGDKLSTWDIIRYSDAYEQLKRSWG